MDGSTLLLVNVVGCLGGGVVGVVFAAVAWRNRETPAAVPYGTLSLAVGGWGIVYAALLLSTDTTTATAFSQLARIASACVPPLWLWFALAYTGSEYRRSRPLVAIVWGIPVFYVVLSATAPIHGLVQYEVAFRTVGGLTAPVDPTGPWFWVFVAYAYAVVAVGFAVLVRFLLRARNLYRKQTAAVVVGGVFPTLGNAAALVGAVPHPALDLTPVLFALNGLVVGWALFRYDFMEVTPVATNTLVDELPDPVLVVDESGTIVEHNEAALDAVDTRSLSGKHVSTVSPALADDEMSTDQLRLRSNGTERVYTPQVSSVRDQHGVVRGRLVVLREITVQQRRLDRIEALQATTQRFLEATDGERIASAAVDFVERELDAPVAVVYLQESGRLVPVAVSEGIDTAELSVTPVEPGHPLWAAAEDSTTRVLDPTTAGLDHLGDAFVFANVLTIPLNGSGLLCVGIDGETEDSADEQFLRILQGTMVAALSRVEQMRQLRESRREVDQRTDQIEFFTGVLRHTIRNAMQVIRGQTDRLETHTDSEGLQSLERIDSWAAELVDLSEEIRMITDVVNAPANERRRPLDLGAVLHEHLSAFEAEHDVALTEDVPASVSVLANDLVGMLLDSVLTNAVEHNDSPTPAVAVTVETTDRFARVRIADNGPGIDDALKRSVFERDVATQQTAHGFGLYFVSVMMDLYDGDVWFEDRTDADPVPGGGEGGTVAVLQFRRVET